MELTTSIQYIAVDHVNKIDCAHNLLSIIAQQNDGLDDHANNYQ